MMTVQLDARGRLLYFEAVPPRMEAASSASDPDWTVALTEAGIDAKSLSVASPRFVPVVGFDRRATWDVARGGESLHVSAAAYRGKPVFFRVAGRWIPPEGNENAPSGTQMRSAQITGITGAVGMLNGSSSSGSELFCSGPRSSTEHILASSRSFGGVGHVCWSPGAVS
jgi:hypothetical protein